MIQWGRSGNWQIRLLGALAVCGAVIASSLNCSLAQIKPDATLGAESSSIRGNVQIKDLPSYEIKGGARRGDNLFHSFRQFNIDEGRGAYFTNPVGVKNILSRVTGKDPSDIQGTLGVDGGANLFLFNPNGIIFGPSSRLDVAGSFAATTASAVGFDNQGFFSAAAPNVPPLLTINPSTFFFNQIATQSITNQSVVGLEVPNRQSLLLLGGNVSLDGGRSLAPGGRVELGGVLRAGTVELNREGNNLSLSYPDDVRRADVSLTNGAQVNVRAGTGGSIAINARNLDVLGRSFFKAGIGSGLGSVESQAGNITLNATEAITVANDGLILNDVEPRAVGNGGLVNIMAMSLSMTSGATLSASTYGQGAAGSVIINTRDGISVDGVSSNGNFPSGVFSTVQSDAIGQGGDIRITTGSLSLTNGAELDVGTFGQGDAGNVIIDAKNTVSLDRGDVFSNVEEGVIGQGGDIRITTRSLSLTNGAELVTTTFSQGDAGDVIINARDNISFDGADSNGFVSGVFSDVRETGRGQGGDIRIVTGSLSLTNGAELVVGTFGQGDAGSVNINAYDTVLFDGVSSNGYSSAAFSSVESGAIGNGGKINIKAESVSLTNGAQVVAITRGHGDAGSVNINAYDTVLFDGVSSNGYSSAAFSSVALGAEGNGGGIDIKTGSLFVTNGAGLSASSRGNGAAGSLEVEARSVQLDNQAVLTTETASGNGGDITLQLRDLLLLSRNSNISTSAGTARAGGNGGNITINTNFIIAIPQENSDITANAFSGSGGKVDIEVQGNIFGLEPLSRQELQNFLGTNNPDELDPSQLPSNNITAVSQTNPSLSGQVTITTPDVDPSEAIANLPTEPVNTEIAQDCQSGGEKTASRFISRGSGGLSTNPYEPLDSRDILADVQPPAEWLKHSIDATPTFFAPKMTAEPVVEAQGWRRNKTGDVILVAEMPHELSQRGCRLR